MQSFRSTIARARSDMKDNMMIEYRIKVTFNDDGAWAYDEDTAMMMIRGRDEPFHHIDRNILTKIAEPTPNLLAR